MIMPVILCFPDFTYLDLVRFQLSRRIAVLSSTCNGCPDAEDDDCLDPPRKLRMGGVYLWDVYICIYMSKKHTYIHTYICTYIPLHCITLHCITLHYITWHDITLHYIFTLHYTWERGTKASPQPCCHCSELSWVPCFLICTIRIEHLERKWIWYPNEGNEWGWMILNAGV